MYGLKRLIGLAAAGALLAFACVALTGCGEQIAATWDYGQLEEEKVTTAITNMRANANLTDDDEGWAKYITERSYDTDAASDAKDAGEGTVADLREYVINELVRQEVIDHEVEAKNIEVTDEEVDAQVDIVRQSVEAQMMKGVFESYLQMMGYEDLEAYKEEVRHQLEVSKLKEQVTGADDADATADAAADDAAAGQDTAKADDAKADAAKTDDAEAADDATSTEDKWEAYVDKLVADAHLKINPAPADLPYDPAAKGTDDEQAGADADASADATADASADDTGVTTDADGNTTITLDGTESDDDIAKQLQEQGIEVEDDSSSSSDKQ